MQNFLWIVFFLCAIAGLASVGYSCDMAHSRITGETLAVRGAGSGMIFVSLVILLRKIIYGIDWDKA